MKKEITSCTCPHVQPKASLRTWRRKTTRLFPPHPVCWCSHGLGNKQNETFMKQISVQSIWIITRIVSRRLALADSNDFASEKGAGKRECKKVSKLRGKQGRREGRKRTETGMRRGGLVRRQGRPLLRRARGRGVLRVRNESPTGHQNFAVHLTATLLIRTPSYHGHFILAWKKLSQTISYLKNPFNTTTPLIRPTFHGPKVVV